MIGNRDNRFSPPRRDEEDDSWMTSFADMATLLLAFFILLASISKVDVVLFEQVKAGMAEGIGRREVTRPIEQMKLDMQDAVKSMQIEDVVGVGTDNQGLTLELASGAFFESGSAQFRPEGEAIFARVAATLAADRYAGFQLEVQGHTDDVPIRTPQYPSNWELSSARASSVVRFLESLGVQPSRMRAVGFGDTSPKVPNRDPFGEPLSQNQEINRRVVIRIYPR